MSNQTLPGKTDTRDIGCSYCQGLSDLAAVPVLGVLAWQLCQGRTARVASSGSKSSSSHDTAPHLCRIRWGILRVRYDVHPKMTNLLRNHRDDLQRV